MNPLNPLFQLAGKYMSTSVGKTMFDQGFRGVGSVLANFSKDPVNKTAASLFGLPYLTIPATAIMGLNAGATAPGTLDEAKRLGIITNISTPTFK
jgi:hypothetical protein